MEHAVDQFLTCKFKLHNPSQRKRAMLDAVLRRSHLAFDKLLRAVKADVEALEGISDKRLRDDARKTITKRLQQLARPLPLGAGPKQAVQVDAEAAIDSYLELRAADKNGVVTGYPAAPRLNQTPDEAYAEALTALTSATTIEEESAARDALARSRSAGKLRPLSIYKNRIDDGALILRDDGGRHFVYINLVTSKDARAKPLDLTGLIHTRDGEVLSKRTSGGALFPLEFGEWHGKKFLSGATIQSSRVIKDGDDYYFAATFKFSAPARPDPVNYMGVDRGIEELAAWVAIDGNLNALACGAYSGQHLRRVQRREETAQSDAQRRGKVYTKRTRMAVADEEVHRAANAIVAAAQRHDARVVFEDLSSISNGPQHKRAPGARKGGFRRMLGRAQYQKLQKVVEYKLALAGFAPARRGKPAFYEVHAAGTSITCFTCGHRDKASRVTRAEFVCTACGATAHADAVGAANTATKGAHFDEIVRGRKKGEKLQGSELWPEWLRSKSGAGRESVLVQASEAFGDTCMTGLGPACDHRGSNTTARKPESASSLEGAPNAKTGISNAENSCENRGLSDGQVS